MSDIQVKATTKQPFAPLVSIIIPVYNGANYMKEAIDSALEQTYQNIEIIVVNDGSNDDGKTDTIARSYGEKIRFFSKENGGCGSALNFGIAQMQGTYFSWLSHDDKYYPYKIEHQINVLSNLHDKNTIIYGGYELINTKSETTNIVHLDTTYPLDKLNTRLFPLLRGLIHGCSLLIPAIYFTKIGVFDETLPSTQDYALWFDIMRVAPIHFDSKILIQSRQHPDQGTNTINNIFEENNVLWSGFLRKLTHEEMAMVDDSPLLFLKRMAAILARTPFKKAESLALTMAGEILKKEIVELTTELSELKRQSRTSTRNIARKAWNHFHNKVNRLFEQSKKFFPTSNVSMSFNYPDRWQLQEKTPLVVKQAKINVLVISYLFPHPDQPGLGSFVLEQIKGLLNTEQDINVRVISGRPYHISLNQIRNPFRTLRHPRCMLHKLFYDIHNFTRGLYNFFSYYKTCNQSWWSIEGVSVKYLPYPFFGEFWTHGWGYQKAITKSVKKLKKTFDFDVIHAHTGYLDGNTARKIASTFNRPCVITEHTGPFTILTEHPFIRGTTVRALKSAKHIVAVSEAQRQKILSCLKNKHKETIHVIPNVVDFDRFYPPSNWSPDPIAPKILFVGYFTPVKNISLLLNAFQRVLIEKPLATLTLVGGGYTLALQSVLSNNQDQAEAGVIYLSKEGPDNYIVRDWNGRIQRGILNSINLSHLEEKKLNDVDFKRNILIQTSAAGHTIGGVHPADYTQQIMQEINTLNLTDSVKVTGPVPHTEVSNFMRNNCDIFALSSVSESFGCVVAEALATGKPVVSTRCGGPEDIITEDWMGTLCENNNPEAFAEAILNLADKLSTIDPKQLRKSAESRFSPKVIAEQYMHLYQQE